MSSECARGAAVGVEFCGGWLVEPSPSTGVTNATIITKARKTGCNLPLVNKNNIRNISPLKNLILRIWTSSLTLSSGYPVGKVTVYYLTLLEQ